MDLLESFSVIDMADSVGFGAKNLMLETFVYHQMVAVGLCFEAADAAACDVAVGIVVVSLVEIVPPHGLEHPKNLIHEYCEGKAVVRVRLKHCYRENKGVVGCYYSEVAVLES